MKIEFKEIAKKRGMRQWGIKIGGKIKHKGFNFEFGKELYEKLKAENETPKEYYEKNYSFEAGV